METRSSGHSALNMPLLGVGCWSFGGGDYWGKQEQKDVDAVVCRAIDIGCNYFDTAEIYNDGASEVSLGRALANCRDKAIIGTKVSPSNTEPSTLKKHCEASLKRLATDYVDIYMVHWPIHPHSIRHFTGDDEIINNPPSVYEAFDMLMRLKKEGKILDIGVSNFGVRQLNEALSTGANIVVNELPYNLLSRAIETEIAPLCQSKGIGIIGYMPLMQGILTGKYEDANSVPATRTRTRHFSGKREDSRHGEQGCEEETFTALNDIRQIALRERLSMSHLAIAWAAANPAVSCVLAGARTPGQLEANANAVSFKLQQDIVEKVNAATEKVLNILGPTNPDYYESSSMSRTW